jgi:hypothetical protein
MGRITLISVVWDDPQPDGPVLVSVRWRLATAPDVPGSYQFASTGTFVDRDGTFLLPVIIDNLDITKAYTVRVTSICGGYTANRTFVYETEAAFSIGFSLGFES